MRRLSLLFVLLFAEVVALSAQSSSSVSYDKVEHFRFSIDFRVNTSHIDVDYLENSRSIHQIEDFFRRLNNDSTRVIDDIIFGGIASPEGYYATNRQLAVDRRNIFEDYIRTHIDIPEHLVHRSDEYIDWGYLITMLKEERSKLEASQNQQTLSDTTLRSASLSPLYTHLDEVIEILSRPEEIVPYIYGEQVDKRVIDLHELAGGAVWEEMHHRYFMNMRSAYIQFVTRRTITVEMAGLHIDSAFVETDSLRMPQDVSPVLISRRPILSLRASLPYTALLAANLGLEYSFAPHWSVEAIGVYSPYDLFAYNRKVRLLGVQPEVRYWFNGRAMQRGHFIGLHGHVLGFNIQLDDDFRYQDPNYALWGAGISYGYALPMGKDSRWGMDFVVGAGYANYKFDRYEGVHNGHFLNRTQKEYWGITRLGINIYYILDYKTERRR